MDILDQALQIIEKKNHRQKYIEFIYLIQVVGLSMLQFRMCRSVLKRRLDSFKRMGINPYELHTYFHQDEGSIVVLGPRYHSGKF